MAKLKSVGATFSATINLGDYNGRKLELWCTADIEEGETLEGASQELFKRIRAVVAAEAQGYLNKVRIKDVDLFHGKEKE